MPSTFDTLATRLLRRLAHSVYHRPRLYIYPQIFLFIVSVAYTGLNLKFTTARSDLVGADQPYHLNFLAYRRDFNAQDEIVAVVESEDMEKNRQFVERLGARLAVETNLFIDVLYNNDVKMLGNKALLFFPERDLESLGQTLREYRPFIDTFSQATNLNSLFALINRQFRGAARATNAEIPALIRGLPALERIVAQAEASLQRPGIPPSPGLTALFDAGPEAERRIYITYGGGRLYLVTARPRTPTQENAAVGRMRELVKQVRREVPGVNAGITGEPVLEFDEMIQAQRDTTIATVVSLALVAVIFIYGYSETGRPIKATICLVVGLGYTMGYTTLAVGHLNILTITFVPMLIGLAIDFGVHLITRYEEELREGRTPLQAIESAMTFTGKGIFTGCFTTSGAFFAMGFTDFKGIREMGIISGGGLLICLVPMMTMLPVLILRGRQNVLDRNPVRAIERRARIERVWLDRPGLVTAITAALCLFSFAKFGAVRFDYNLLNMQSKGLPAVVFEKKLIHAAERGDSGDGPSGEGEGKSVLYCAVIAKSLSEALALETRITNLPAVATVQSMARYLTEDQARKLTLIGQIKQELVGIEFAAMDASAVDVATLRGTLESTQGYLGRAVEAVAKSGDADLEKQLTSLRAAIGGLLQRMRIARDQASSKLAAFQRALFRDIHETFAALGNQDDRDRLRAEDLPPPIRNRFVSKSGQLYLLQVFPKADVWQRDKQEEFVGQLRTVDPNVTGTPVQLLEYTTLLKNSYQEAAWYALGAIALLVFVHFRSLTCTVLALLPAAIGTIWMLGFMGWTNIPFNPANIMTLPLVIGIGVTSGIHILNRFAEEERPDILAKSTGKAVLVSALTTIVGFGSLILAKHQGIATLGYVMAVGTATCMLAAVTFLPAVLNFLCRRGWSFAKKTTQ